LWPPMAAKFGWSAAPSATFRGLAAISMPDLHFSVEVADKPARFRPPKRPGTLLPLCDFGMVRADLGAIR
jgi:hypothetical protein